MGRKIAFVFLIFCIVIVLVFAFESTEFSLKGSSSSCEKMSALASTNQLRKAFLQQKACFDDLLQEEVSSEDFEHWIVVSRLFRYSLDLFSARRLWEAFENKKGTKERLPFSVRMERLLVGFELTGGIRATQRLLDLERDHKVSESQVSPIQLLKIYFSPYQNLQLHLEWLDELEKNYLKSFEQAQPSLLFWIHITRSKVYRRMNEPRAASQSLTEARKSMELNQPDLGFEKAKYFFEMFIQGVCYGTKNTDQSLEKFFFHVSEAGPRWARFRRMMLESVAKQRVSPDSLKSLDLRMFGPGHFVVEALEFVVNRCGRNATI